MRLIDADALIKTLGIDDLPIRLTYEIENAPTVDAVPVIRCRDCKWYYRGGATCMYWDGENGMRGDDYCSQAERKEHETD